MFTIAGGILIALAALVVLSLSIPVVYFVRKVLRTPVSNDQTSPSVSPPERR
jgi:hypothetical protein